jgi:hypothetical protein
MRRQRLARTGPASGVLSLPLAILGRAGKAATFPLSLTRLVVRGRSDHPRPDADRQLEFGGSTRQ